MIQRGFEFATHYVPPDLIFTVIKILILFGVMQLMAGYLTLAERKFSAFIQDRIGPNRVGPFGLLQPLADGVKFIFKEDVIPIQAHKFYYVIAPTLALIPAFIGYCVVPFGDTLIIGQYTVPLQIADVDLGILFILAITGIAVYGIFMAGWASNNKYSLLAGLRASAQMMSYELTMGLSLVGALMIFQTPNLREIAVAQMSYWHVGALAIPKWGIFLQPLGFLLFIIAAYAESNRQPFDLVEAETELVGGFHTEYGSMKFAMFYMGEYVGMVTLSAIMTLFFFGAWHIPYVENLAAWNALSHNARTLLGTAFFATKVGFFLFLFIWVRWTLPRFRYDQLMSLSWKAAFPLALANIFFTGLAIYYFKI